MPIQLSHVVYVKCSNIGDEWLVTDKDTESYIPDVTEVWYNLDLKPSPNSSMDRDRF